MANTIGDFLVKLGFTVDQAQAKRFGDTITHGIKGVNELRIAIVAMAVGAEEAIRRVTNSFDRLYFVSRATGVTVQGLEKLRSEYRGAGLDAQQATADAEAFTDAIRRNPGVIAQAQTAIGGSFRDFADFQEKAARRLNELLKANNWNELAPAVQNYEHMLQNIAGVNFDNILRLGLNQDRVNRYAAITAEIYKRLKLNADDAAKSAVAIDEKFFKVGETLRLGFARFLLDDRISGAIQKITDAIAKWLTDPDSIKQFGAAVKEIATDILAIVRGIAAAIGYAHDLSKTGTEKYTDPRTQKGGEWEAEHKTQGWSETAPVRFFNWMFGIGKPGFQHGGIVPINAHPGEMVLPRQISEGLQSLFMGGGAGDGGGLREQFERWWGGDTAFRPIVDLADQVYEKLRNLMLNFFDERKQGETPGAPGGPQSATPGGPGGGPGGGPSDTDQAGMLSQKALEAIAKGEGTLKAGGIDYSEIYGGKHADLAHMTLAQVMALQQHMIDTIGHSPVGAFQIVRGTLGEMAKKLNLDPNTTMLTPEVQRAMATELYRERGLQPWTNPSTRSGATQQAFEQLKQSGQLFAAGPQIGGGGTPLGSGSGGPAAAVDDMLRMEGMSETKDRQTLIKFMKTGGMNIDPAVAAWCAAFVNAALAHEGVKGTGSMMASSFGPSGKWGHVVNAALGVAKGDTVYTPSSNPRYSGHVGQATGVVKWINGQEWIERIAGNTADHVKRDWVAAGRATVRRADPTYIDRSTNHTVINNQTDPHGAARAVTDQKDKRSAMHMRHFRTYVA